MATSKRRKPVPKTQSQLTREQIEAYDTTRGTVPALSKQNRENQVSLKNDKTKLPTVSFKDIDSAIFYYFQNVIKPTVMQNSTQIDVPVMYGNPERWSAVQKDGFLRDSNGKIQVPLIMFKKQSIEKNRSLGNKIDGNEVSNFAVYQKKYSKGNIYDQFSRLTNRTPSQEMYGVVIPDYVTVTYQCVIFTDYVEQTDKLIEALNFFYEEEPITITKEDLDLQFDFRTFFQNYKAINARFLAERIGMNQSLLAQYTSGVKTPSQKQLKKIMAGIHSIGEELNDLTLLIK